MTERRYTIDELHALLESFFLAYTDRPPQPGVVWSATQRHTADQLIQCWLHIRNRREQ